MGSCVGFRKDDGPVVGEPVLFFLCVCLFVCFDWSLGICIKNGSCSLIAFIANPECGRRKMKQRTQAD